MIVRLNKITLDKLKKAGVGPPLTPGKNYAVLAVVFLKMADIEQTIDILGQEGGFNSIPLFVVKNDDNIFQAYSANIFDTVSADIPDDWVMQAGKVDTESSKVPGTMSILSFKEYQQDKLVTIGVTEDDKNYAILNKKNDEYSKLVGDG